jgi:hypothetical protein
MEKSTKILLLIFILPLLSYFLIYCIAKSDFCTPNCKNKKCGQSDGCSSICKSCPTGQICDGKKCQNIPPEYVTCCKSSGCTKNVSSDNCKKEGGTTVSDCSVCIIPKKTKGICYFDIDNTLTTAQGNPDDIINECLNNDFAVGIITASSRKVNNICNGDKASQHWMSDILCKQFNENNAKMYNSSVLVAGKQPPSDWPSDKISSDPGYVKGWDMEYGRKNFFPEIPEKCVVLFDDDPNYIAGVKRFNKQLQTQCSNTSCGEKTSLNIDIVKKTIDKMKKNGCV